MTADSKAMEIKKTQTPLTQPAPVVPKKTPTQTSTSTPPTAKFGLKNILDYIDDIKTEFYKITWTTREELIVYTQIVVVATFLMGIAVFFVDVLLQSAMALLRMIVQALFG